jgi:HEPN domain-containing protein
MMAETLAEGAAPPWGICYHVQQAVEKGLKALLVAAGSDPPWTHNLVRLNRALDPAPFSLDDEDVLASLTVWSVRQRYPANQPEPTAAETADALEFGRAALARIEALLPAEEV